MLYSAMKTNVGGDDDDSENGGPSALSFDISSKVIWCQNCEGKIKIPQCEM